MAVPYEQLFPPQDALEDHVNASRTLRDILLQVAFTISLFAILQVLYFFSCTASPPLHIYYALLNEFSLYGRIYKLTISNTLCVFACLFPREGCHGGEGI